MSIQFKIRWKRCLPAILIVGNLCVTTHALETPFTPYKDGYANSTAYTGNSRTLIVRSDSKGWMSHPFPDGSGKGLQGARLQVYVKDVVHDGVLKVYLAPALGALENQTHFSDLVSKDSVGGVIIKAADHIQHVVEIPLNAAFTKAIQDNAYAGLIFESSGNLDAELGALEGDHGAVILLNYNSSSTVITSNVISVDSLAKKLFEDHSSELRGPAGTNGSNGGKGDVGLTGPQGPKGDSGARGPQGIQGIPGVNGKDGASGTGGSTTSLPATAITGLDTFVVNRTNSSAAGKASLSGAAFTGPISTTGNATVTGGINVNGAINTVLYGVNVNQGYISTDSSYGFRAFGVGGPSQVAAGNTEFLEIYHDGAANQASINVSRSGTGKIRNLMLKTGGTAALTIDSLGKVGIGTTTPQHKLHISNPDNTTTAAARAFVETSGIPNYGEASFGVQTPDGAWEWFMDDKTGNDVGTGNLGLWQKNKGLMMVIKTDSSFGLGVKNPVGKLDIKAKSIGWDGQLVLRSSTSSDARWDVLVDGGDYDNLRFAYNSSSGIKEVMKLTPSGDLKMIGDIRANETSNLYPRPDYVFEPAYSLMPLSEVRDFTRLNKHLPRVPSKEDVAEKGVGLFEDNHAMLEKLEEAYLYIFELSDANKKLQKRMDVMEKKLAKTHK